ncbi:MAG: aminoacyl-tRNA hydrolase [Lachnospiraceae bacterium]|nr:aminoacyl-tRNA hydrolase [Lachnospiraceae bacterium]
MKIIIGLGNPGKEYETTRHNMGFMTVDKIARKHNIEIIDLKHKGLCGKGMIGGEKVLLVKPQTYMNNSGECVRETMDYYKVQPEDIIIIYDDIDLDPGQLRIRTSGSAGSHNGMKSVVSHMGTQAFPRVRVGVGAKPEGWDLADYVLSHITPEADKEIVKGTDEAAEAVECILSQGISEAMNHYNRHEHIQ